MRMFRNSTRKLAGAAATLAIGMGLAVSAQAQTVVFQPDIAPSIAPPGWIDDAGFYSLGGRPPHFFRPFLANRYLYLWVYHAGADIGKFVLWNNEGDPYTSGDNLGYYVRYNADGTAAAYEYPWGSPLFSGEQPGRGTGNTRPIADIVSLRIDDGAGQFQNFEFPEGGTTNIVFSYPDGTTGPIGIRANGQGTIASYTYSGGTGAGAYNLRVSQRYTLVRDMLRIEYVVSNPRVAGGTGGGTRQVGMRMVLAPYADDQGPSTSFSTFFRPTRPGGPQGQERLLFERDYGRQVGTTIPPRFTNIPDRYEVYDDDIGPFHSYVAKGLIREAGVTPPDRVVFGNGLQIFSDSVGGQLWDYDVDTTASLQFADLTTILYWNPTPVPVGGSRTFVTYVGVGAASHSPSSHLLQFNPAATSDLARDTLPGYMAAVQTPFALPVVEGQTDLASFPVDAYVQNVFSLPSDSNQAVITVPDGLEFVDPETSNTLELGSTGPLGGGFTPDEVSGRWQVVPNGELAGYLPINVLFGNSFGDPASVTRFIHVPQGARYRFDDNWKMVTFPFSYANGNNDPAVVLGVPAGNYQILGYNPLINQYEPVTEIEAGKSYWVRMRGLGRTDVRLTNARPNDLSGNQLFFSFVRRGWNQIGNPSPYAVPVKDLQFVTPSAIISYDDAVTRNYIKATLYEYNARTGRYDQLGRDSVVSPGRGIWVFASGERNILWPPPVGPDVQVFRTTN